MKTRRSPLTAPVLAVMTLVLCLLSSAGVVANDLAKHQLAVDAATSSEPAQRALVLQRTRDYEEGLTRLAQQIRDANATTGLLAGVFLGFAVTKSPAGGLLGGVTGALARSAIADWLNRSLLHKSTRLTLMSTRAEDSSLYDDLIESRPGTEERLMLTRGVVDGSPYLELLSRLDVSDSMQGPLLDHTSSLEEYLLDLDLGVHADVGGMTSPEAADFVKRELPALRNVVVEYGEALREGRSRLLELSHDVNDIVERIETNDASPNSENSELTFEFGSVVVQRGDGIVIPDRVFTETGDILDMFGRRLGEHTASLDSIEGELIDLNDSYRRLLSEQDFQQSLIYEALPTEAKLRALENPEFMRHLQPTQREEIRERLELQQDIHDTIEAAQDLASVTFSMGNILTRSGIVEGEDAGRVHNGVGLVASTAIAVAGCYALEVVSCLGGVSGMVTGLSNLFGGTTTASSRLAEDQRRLMEGQRALLEGQLKVRQELQAAHADVLENRLALFEVADAIDTNMRDGFADVHTALGAMSWELGQLRETEMDFSELGTMLRRCEAFVARRAEFDDFDAHVAYVPDTVRPAFAPGEFSTWESLRSHFATNGADWKSCLGVVRDLFSRRQTVRDLHSVFRLSTYRARVGGGTLLTDYVNPGFAPLVRLMSRHYRMGAGDDGMRTFCALLNSPLTYAGIDVRGATLFERESCAFPGTIGAFNTLWRRNVGSTVLAPDQWLIHIEALVELSWLMMELLPYYQITDEEGERLLDVDLVADGVSGKPADEGRVVETEIVETAYRLASVAIAQQVLLTGDIFLPLIHRYLFSERAVPSDRNDVIDVLKHNPTIARNWLVMEVRRQLQLRMSTPGGFAENLDMYRRVFESRRLIGADRSEGFGYERFFPSYWVSATATVPPSVAFSGNELVFFEYGAEDGEVRIPMPTPNELARGSYAASRGYLEAVRLRRAIIEYSLRNELELFDGAEFLENGHFVWHPDRR